VLDNTYIIYASDNGFHMGAFGLPDGKGTPMEEDARVPLFMRGPGARLRGTRTPHTPHTQCSHWPKPSQYAISI
jgi:arylsulfatase A-like enzyme